MEFCPVAKDDLYVLKQNYICKDAPCQFAIGYRMGDGTYSPSTAVAVCFKWVASFLPSFQQAVSEDVIIDQISFGPIGISTELAGFVNGSGAAGVLIGDALPANMCAIVHFGSTAPNSKHNGRIYLSGVPEDLQFEGTMTAPQITRVQDFADLLDGPLVPDSPEDADFEPVVISRFLDGVKRVPPVGFDILSPVAKADIRQMQSRTTHRLGLS